MHHVACKKVTIKYHVCIVVVPQAHDQDHAPFHCFAHLLEAAQLLVVVVVLEQVLRVAAEVVRDGVVLSNPIKVHLKKI